ncbi:hypothetical protein WJX77_001608 [Trebouxia sp. C0004]
MMPAKPTDATSSAAPRRTKKVSGGNSRKRSLASTADWEDEDLGQDARDALELPEDDDNVSTMVQAGGGNHSLSHAVDIFRGANNASIRRSNHNQLDVHCLGNEFRSTREKPITCWHAHSPS